MIGCLNYVQNCELQKYSGWLKNLEHHLCRSKLSSLKPKFESFHGDGHDDDNDADDVQWLWSGVTKKDRLTWTDLLIFLRFASSIREMSSALKSNKKSVKMRENHLKSRDCRDPSAAVSAGPPLVKDCYLSKPFVTDRKIGRMTYF